MLMIKILVETPPDPATINPAIPPELAAAIGVAMHRDPMKRFQSCTDLRARLRPLAGEPDAGQELGRDPVDQGEKRSSREKPAVREGSPRKVYDAVFVCLWPTATEVRLKDGALVRVLPLEDEHSLPAVLADGFPQLIVSSVPLDLAALVGHFPAFRVPVILIDIKQPHDELCIQQWRPTEGAYGVRRAPMTELDTEINAILSTPQPPALSPGEMQQIGLSHHLDAEDGPFFVETEVRCRDAIEIVTKVWRQGHLLDKKVQVVEAEGAEIVGRVEQRAGAQHDEALKALSREEG
jgi:hypothetical protein